MAHPIAITAADMGTLANGLRNVWNIIGSDLLELYDHETPPNAVIIDACCDADRLLSFGERDAYNIFRTLTQHHSYTQVLSFLSKKVDLT